MLRDPARFAASLSCWSHPSTPEPLKGGLSNKNFIVRDEAGTFVVRVGDDIPVHHVFRAVELSTSRAAARAGLSPDVHFSSPGAIVLRYIDGARALSAEDLTDPDLLTRAIALIKQCHRDMPRHLRGPAPFFWVFHVLRDYVATLSASRSAFRDMLPRLAQEAEILEGAVGSIDLVFGHNDLLPANLIDDGQRLWLIDWEYGGYNSPLFDLGGLASNADLSAEQEDRMLELYFECPPSRELKRRYRAMKCASLLRESMWAMISELHLDLDFDYAAYARQNLSRFERARAELERD
jgi:thiamine kinase-like enzyme